jgi:hypothetical protein
MLVLHYLIYFIVITFVENFTSNFSLYEELRWYSTGPELRSLLESWSITNLKASVFLLISGLLGPMLMHSSGLA